MNTKTIITLVIFFNFVKSIEEESFISIEKFVADDCSGKLSTTEYRPIKMAKCLKSDFDD